MRRTGFVSLSFFAAMMATATLAQDAARTVTATGLGIVYVTPDQAVLDMTVTTFDSDLSRLRAGHESACARVLEAVRGAGVQPADVETTATDVDVRGDSGRADRYQATRQYLLTLREIKSVDPVMNAALRAGAGRMRIVGFRAADIEKRRDEARKLAVKAAADKAKLLAEQLNCGVGRPLTITDWPFSLYPWPYPPANASSATPTLGSAASTPALSQIDMTMEEGSETTPPGQIAVRARVTVMFALTG